MLNQIRDLHTVDKESFPYIFEQNATVPLHLSEGLVRVNVYRPKRNDKVPVLVTYGLYGKDISYEAFVFRDTSPTKLFTRTTASIPSPSQK